jgi:hypothetical protein
MPIDDNEPYEENSERDEPTSSARDARGRWLPGHCPNPKGRPKKSSRKFEDQSDIRKFASTLVPISANGQKQLMDRKSALLHKIFETAMKGNVSAQRHLFGLFEKNTEKLAELRFQYECVVTEWFINNPDLGKSGYQIPPIVEAEVYGMRVLLNRYFPDEYPLDHYEHGDEDEDDDEEGEYLE